MIEYLVERETAHINPALYFLAGIFYSILSVILALILFPDQSSVGHVLLAAIAISPLIFRALEGGARIIDEKPDEAPTVQALIISLYLSYMFGAILGFQISYTFVSQPERELLLKEQMKELSYIEGVRLELTGMVEKADTFWVILSNNIRVYLLSILLSFLYGTGGILLLNWNASIISALFVEEYTTKDLLHALSSIISILPHGLLEFIGYFIGGITGVFIGISIIQEGWNKKLLKDTLMLFVVGLFFIFLGALVESGLL